MRRPRRQEKAPAGFRGASSLQGLKNARLPRVPKSLLWVGLTSNQFSLSRGIFAIACCSRATAREAQTRYCRPTLTMIGG
jgi:hypothetical protein